MGTTAGQESAPAASNKSATTAAKQTAIRKASSSIRRTTEEQQSATIAGKQASIRTASSSIRRTTFEEQQAPRRMPRVSVQFDPSSQASPARRGRDQDAISATRARSTGGHPEGQLFNPDLDPRGWPDLGAALTRGPRQR